jgi:hypothetical protein
VWLPVDDFLVKLLALLRSKETERMPAGSRRRSRAAANVRDERSLGLRQRFERPINT